MAEEAKELLKERLGIALFDFEGEREDMLGFKAGDIIIVTEQNSNGWWKGRNLREKTGIFPHSFVELKVESLESFPTAKAVYALPANPEDPEALFFEENEVITILREINGDWRYGKRENGDLGRFPFKYVQLTGEFDEKHYQKEVERWNKIEEEKKKEEAKIEIEKEELKKKYEEDERYKLELKLKEEIKKNEERIKELEDQVKERDNKIKKLERQLEKSKMEFKKEREDATRALEKVKSQNAEMKDLRQRMKGLKNQPEFGRQGSYTAENLVIDEDPFADEEEGEKKTSRNRFKPVMKVVYNNPSADKKTSLDPEKISSLATESSNKNTPLVAAKKHANASVSTQSWI